MRRGGSKPMDLTGQRKGMLTAIRLTNKRDHYGRYWLCKCDCGNEIMVRASYFKTGHIKSCGCRKRLPLLIKEA